MSNDKECFKCGSVKPLSAFYKHKQMKGGHVNKCKECYVLDVAKHRIDNIDRIRAYDRGRGARQSDTYLKEYRDKYPKKYKATTMVNNQKRAGNIFELPCEACGEIKVVAHHDDYDKPLNVRWLCHAHHSQWHAENGEGKNSV